MKKLTIYLKSGQSIELKCVEASFSFNAVIGEYRGYSVTGADKEFAINPKEIVAWTAKEALF
ncbi:hypothetical protein D3C74_481300 [compost metagenome]